MPIVVGVDESPVSERVLSRAIDEAKLRGDALHAVHVFHPPALYLATTLTDPQRLETEHRARVWERLGPLLDAARLETERVDLRGYPPELLCDYIDNVDASLVVVGTRGRGDLTSLLLGSTSHRVAQSARCDVLIVKK